jgi:hypothetical protein
MEAVTAFLEGPGCLLICWAMLKAKPWRFTAILLVSLGQLYGDVLYFGTCIHGGEQGLGCTVERAGSGVCAGCFPKEAGCCAGQVSLDCGRGFARLYCIGTVAVVVAVAG